ncbi:tartrate dehydrogenase [Halobacillus salinarum]|uniref:D-malate dehydrogenase (decarboxylating) n=1 Tax=Halobacillus salinarum TaxID=2932257 RepID=A0ABY4EKN0_9BACI|nr:tartrate dehydrogenase [Halobacillus salinarum]UOQ44189.1 tartrate dehydrogenase [Halobacillus salinarum]
MRNYKIAVIPGDGIGKEVVPVTMDVLNHAAECFQDAAFTFTEFPWGCDYYLEHGKMMDDDGIEQLEEFDAILLGAVGDPERVPDHISLWGLLIKIRRSMEQSLNIRPAKFFKGLASPLADPRDFDIMVVRENSEGEYSEAGGRIHRGQDELAIQNAVFTRKASERAIRYGYQLAGERKGKLTSATKSNGIVHSMPFWDEIFKEVSQEFPNVEATQQHIDALAAFMVSKPHEFDVIVASNLFGDILTDLGGAIMGSIGIAPAANLNTNGDHPSMFEPVHGSAPDIYGQGIANPLGQIWTAKMMLDHLGEFKMGESILDAIESTTAAGIKTQDIGGDSSTVEVAREVCDRIKFKE